MKKIILLTILMLPICLISQELEWNVNNTASNPGERVVAIIDAGSIGPYDGIGIVGTIIDNNGNWGYNYPTTSNFSAYIKFSSGLAYGIIQDKKTKNIVLRLRQLSNSKFHLTANLPYVHRGARVIIRKVEGNVSFILGDTSINDTSGNLVLSEPTYRNLFIGNNETGNVGIGTTLPDEKLTVKGIIHTQEVRVDLNGAVAPDYVFKKEYKLKTIEEVEAYIKDKGHLSNIPSAKEMEEDGFKLKEMNLKLLEKIEELTLYTIDQEKRLKRLEKLNVKIINLLAKSKDEN